VRINGQTLVDRNASVRLTFDGLRVPGFARDTVPSALLAADDNLLGLPL